MTAAASKVKGVALAGLAGLACVALMVVLMAGAANAAVDWTDLTTGLTTQFEGAVTTVLPVIGGIMAIFLAYKTIRKFVKA